MGLGHTIPKPGWPCSADNDMSAMCWSASLASLGSWGGASLQKSCLADGRPKDIFCPCFFYSVQHIYKAGIKVFVFLASSHFLNAWQRSTKTSRKRLPGQERKARKKYIECPLLSSVFWLFFQRLLSPQRNKLTHTSLVMSYHKYV